MANNNRPPTPFSFDDGLSPIPESPGYPRKGQEAPPAPKPARSHDGEPTRPQRHVLRPPEQYKEYEENLELRLEKHEYPQDFDLQWVTVAVWGRPEMQNRARYERGGWVAVHQEDFGGLYRGRFMPSNVEGEITKDGLVLMARSKSWSDRAKSIDINRARQRVQIKEQQLRMGDLNGVTLAPDHPTAVRSNIIERSIDTVSMPVPTK